MVASNDGSDDAPGTLEQPFETAQKLVSSLQPGMTGCLRAGTYLGSGADQVNIGTPNVTLTSYPGERATVKTLLWVEQTGDGVTVSNLDLDGRNKRGLPSPIINGDDITFTGNDITNHHTGICVSIGTADTYGRAHRAVIENNRIHDCGNLPSTNYDHGIYVNSADDTVIRNNWIYDNADRGIQLYPDAQGTLVTGNVIDGNGEGVIFGGSDKTASSNNIVEHNVITNSRLRDNVESSWGGPIGTGNIARNNCVGGGAYDDGDGGILAGPDGKLGFRASGNTLAVPDFADAAADDFSIDPASACGKILGLVATDTPPADDPPVTDPPPDDPPVTNPPPDDPPVTTPPEAEVTLAASRHRVRAMKPIRVRGRAPGATRVSIQIRRDGGWHRIAAGATASNGAYRTKVRIRRPGTGRIKAVAGGLRDSRPVALRIEKRRG